jgi:hypothetical protein
MPTLLSLLYCFLNLPVQYYTKTSCAHLRFIFFFNFSFGNGDEVEKGKMFTDAFDHVFFS